MDVGALLDSLAETPEAVESYRLSRQWRGGEPALWDEQLHVSSDGEIVYSRRRSPVDEGGVPIGVWRGKAEPKTVGRLAKALRASEFWTLPGETVLPGQFHTVFKVQAGDDTKQLTFTADSPLNMKLSDVDLWFRRIMNRLVDRGEGMALGCEFDPGSGQISLRNRGDKAFIIANPFQPSGTLDYLRVEIAAAAKTNQGVTVPALIYKPAPMDKPASLPKRFTQDFLQLEPRESLVMPVSVPVQQYQGHYVRAVYSSYIDIPDDPESDLIRGRVFSREFAIDR